MTDYIILGFIALVVLIACFPTRKEASSWHTPEPSGHDHSNSHKPADSGT